MTQKPVKYKLKGILDSEEYECIKWDGDSNLANDFFGLQGKEWTYTDSGMTRIWINCLGTYTIIKIGDYVLKNLVDNNFHAASEEFLNNAFVPASQMNLF